MDATSSAFAIGEDLFQLPVESLVGQTWDVIIVGAGPAGCAAAIELAARGYRVLLADRGEFPREKVCGDGLTGNACKLLKRLGLFQEVSAAGCLSRELSIFSPSGIELRLPGDYLTVRRSILDDLLAKKAVERGVVFVRGSVGRIIDGQGDSIAIRFDEGGELHSAACCLLATGSRTGLARQLDLVREVRPSGVALRCYVRSSLPLDRLVVSYAHHLLPGYGWIFPVGNQEFNIGCGVFLDNRKLEKGRLGRALQVFLEKFPLAGELLAAGRMISPPRSAVLRSGLDYRPSRKWRKVLPVGEVVGTTTPCTGEGIGQAMQSGLIAAELVHESFAAGDPGCLQQYGPRLDLQIGQYHSGCQAAQKWLTRPWLADLIARRAEKSPFLRDGIKAMLQETKDPGLAFSWRGVWRSLWC